MKSSGVDLFPKVVVQLSSDTQVEDHLRHYEEEREEAPQEF